MITIGASKFHLLDAQLMCWIIGSPNGTLFCIRKINNIRQKNTFNQFKSIYFDEQ